MKSTVENTMTGKPAPEPKRHEDLPIAIIGVAPVSCLKASYEQARAVAAALCGQASTPRAAPICAAE